MTDDDWLRRELEAMTPEELDKFYLRMARGGRLKGKTITHINGDINDNSLANLRVVDIRDNQHGNQ